MAEDDWRGALDGLLAAPRSGDAVAHPLALQVQVRETLPRTAHRWNGPTTRAATAGAVGALRLGARPVVRADRGWTRTGLTWSSLPHVRNRLGLDAAQHRWACELGALHRAAVPAATGQDPDWLFLDESPNALLWPLLRQAAALGVALVGAARGSVRLADRADLVLDAVRADEGVRIAPRLTIDGDPVDPAAARPIGDHGVWWAGDPAHVVLAPFERPADPALLARDPLLVPAAAAAELAARWLPALQERFAVASSDGSVRIPRLRPPRLVAEVRTAAGGAATLTWRWEGLAGRPAPPFGSLVPGDLVPAGPGGSLPPLRTLTADEALDLAADVLPRLAGLDDVEVVRTGAPAPTVVAGEPVIAVTAQPTERPDWFDLGVTVEIDGRDVPFGPLFHAIAAGRRRLRLVDGAVLSLGHPRLRALVELVEEAAELPEWTSGFAVPRVRAPQWADFEDVADRAEAAVGWRALRDAIAAPPEPVPVPAGLRAELRPYQRAGLDWLAFLHRHGLGGVLADDMGLGKTLQCLALVQHLRETAPPGAPVLVVAPTSVASNWVAEAARFTPELTVRLIRDADREGARIADAAAGADVVVTTYARLRLDAAAFTAAARSGGFAAVLLDEAQAVKNAAGVTHGVVRDLGLRTVAITGTPLENSLTELHALLALTSPGLFPSTRRFREEYLRPIEGLRAGFTEGVGAGNAPEANAAHRVERLARLRDRIRPFVLRRTKAQVAPELPPVEEQTVQVDLGAEHRTLYDLTLQRERRKLFGLLPDLDRNRFIVLRSLTLLRLLALDAALIDPEHDGMPASKRDLLAQELAEAVAEGRRVLVFSQFPSYLRLVGDRLDAEAVPWTLLEGATRDRDAVIGRFRDGEAAVFLISLKAGGFGLNLTEADLVYLVDPWWNPAAEQQAIDRTHRIGQDRPVTVRRLVAAGTIEEKVVALQQRKRDLFAAVVDEGDPFSAALTADDVRALLA